MSDPKLINRHLAPLLRLIRLTLDPNDPPTVPPSSLWVIKEARTLIDEGEPVAAEPLIKLGNIEFGLGEAARAIEYYKQAALQAEADSKRELAGAALVNSGAVYLGQRQFQMAIRIYQRALGHASATEDHRSRASSLIGMALAFKNIDSEAMARHSLDQACQIAKEHDLPDLQARALQQLGFFDYASGNFKLAIAQLRLALDLYAQTGNCIDQVRACFNIALVYADSGDGEAALRHLERARELRDTHNLRYGDRKIEDAMDEIRRQTGKVAS